MSGKGNDALIDWLGLGYMYPMEIEELELTLLAFHWLKLGGGGLPEEGWMDAGWLREQGPSERDFVILNTTRISTSWVLNLILSPGSSSLTHIYIVKSFFPWKTIGFYVLF